MRSRVYLFDIDGTLITTDGAGRIAIEEAFFRLYNRRDLLNFSFAGMTDIAIVRAGLAAAGYHDPNGEMKGIIDCYLDLLPAAVADAKAYRVHPGVDQLIARLQTVDRAALGLGTGNIKRGAEIKLSRGGLAETFTFGGYADDNEDRAKLLMIGAARGAAYLNCTVDDCDVFVIGDTPRDITAGKSIGATTIAVATGPFSVAELGTYSPSFVCEDLTDEQILAQLGIDQTSMSHA